MLLLPEVPDGHSAGGTAPRGWRCQMDLLPVWAVGLSAGAGKGGRNLTRTLTPRNGGTKTYTVKHGDLFAIRAIRPLQIDVLSHPDGGNRYRVRLTDLDQGGKSSHTD